MSDENGGDTANQQTAGGSVVRIEIEFDLVGKGMKMNAPVGHLALCLGILEMAKEAVLRMHREQDELVTSRQQEESPRGRILVPRSVVKLPQ